MGYEAELLDCEGARTVAYEPGNQVIKVAEVNQRIALDLSADGRLAAGVPGVASDAGLPLAAGVSTAASTQQGFLLSLRVDWSAVEIQAGPIGAGGARWNIYRQTSRLDRHHRLVQTLLVPSAVTTVTIEVKTWVRRRGWFFGLFGTREWSPPPRRFPINIETPHPRK